MIFMRVIIGIRSHLLARITEWLLAAEMGAEGLQLLRTTDTLGSTHAYSFLKALASENAWGAIALSLAAFWMVALILNGTFEPFRRISPWVRSTSAFAAGLYWTVFATGMAIGNPDGTGAINHGGFAALAVVYSVITAREVAVADKEAKRCRHRSRPQLGGL